MEEKSPLWESLEHYLGSLARRLDDLADDVARSYENGASSRKEWGRVKLEHEELRALLYGGEVCYGPWDDDPCG